jgi:hypothetical protein
MVVSGHVSIGIRQIPLFHHQPAHLSMVKPQYLAFCVAELNTFLLDQAKYDAVSEANVVVQHYLAYVVHQSAYVRLFRVAYLQFHTEVTAGSRHCLGMFPERAPVE